MTNVVLVRHEADYGFGNYLFETPVDLKKRAARACENAQERIGCYCHA